VLWNEISKEVFAAVISQRPVVLALLTCCLLSALLCLVSHRPDQDDFAYVPNVIYYLEHPDEPMGFKVHFIDSGREDEPFASYHRCSIPFEYSQGIVSYITGMHLLTVYYFFGPALFGCMIPLVWFYIISRFSFPPHAAVTGAFFICLSLILMGEQHRSFGNFAFNRISQGKTVMFTVGIPLFVGLTMEFFQLPSVRRWVYLFVTSVAMVGLTTTAAMMIPLLAIVLSISCSLSYVTTMKARIITIFKYLFTLVYPALYAGSILLLSMDQLGIDKPINRGWPTTFLGSAKLVLNGPVVILFLIAGTISAIVLVQKRERRFLITWDVLVIVLYLNPLVSPFVIKYVTSPNIYWRLFYLLPFPLVLGLSGAALASQLETVGTRWRRVILIGAGAFLLAAHLPASSSSVFRCGPNVTKLGMPRYKVKEVYLEQARKVLALNPPLGTMLAPQGVDTMILMLSAQYPQISYKATGILMWMEECGRRNEGMHRIVASRFLGGRIGKKDLKSLVWVIRQNPQIRSIVADRRVAELNNSYLFRLFSKLGYSEYKLTDELVVFMRPGSKE